MMHRGTSLEQDARFSRAKKKKAGNVPAIFQEKLVDPKSVLWESIDRWVEIRTTALLEGVEDEILVGYIHERVTSADVDPSELAADLEGFLGEKALGFVEELWKLLVDASSNPAGVPRAFMTSHAKDGRRRELDSRRHRGDDRHRRRRDRSRSRSRSRSPRRSQSDRRRSREVYIESKDDLVKKEEVKE
jgi:hypothetical protein